MEIIHLTPAEEQLMHLFWKINSFYLKDVMEQHPEPKPHRNTVSTYLKILVDKKFLSIGKEGRIFKYTVAIPFDDYRKFLLNNLTELYFNNSAPEIVKVMLEEKILNTRDLSSLFEIKTTVVPLAEEPKKETPISEFIEKLTEDKNGKKKKKKKDKKKKK
ncbi:MAG: BlaI/MecI/CopY family transcriptional regulator [Bergeyella sp.]